MSNAFDPYREALVVETQTEWPAELGPIEADQRRRWEALLHADAAEAGHLQYVRLATGFCRKITVTPDDLTRLKTES